MERHGYVTTSLSTNKKIVVVGSFEGGHDCCYQYAALDKQDVAELIEDLKNLHSEMEDV